MFTGYTKGRNPKRSARADGGSLKIRMSEQVVNRCTNMLNKAESTFNAMLNNEEHSMNQSFFDLWEGDLSDNEQRSIFAHYQYKLGGDVVIDPSKIETIVGLCYLQGIGVEANQVIAYKHFSRAAQTGYAPAIREKAIIDASEVTYEGSHPQQGGLRLPFSVSSCSSSGEGNSETDGEMDSDLGEPVGRLKF